jgi:formylmethanofuran--tetrahydromethanopterin N-formyltransferase
VEIEETFAEAFGMWGSRLIITGANLKWVHEAASKLTGFATSIIACGCEAGIEREADETPDGRPGINVLIFARTKELLEQQLISRIGQCVLTCPTTSCFNGLISPENIPVGERIRFFGDGFQNSKVIGERRFWRIPVMEGEFLIEENFGAQKGVAGGNILILGENQDVVLQSAESAAEAMRRIPNVILPFPGGIVRSGSKVGSKYKFLIASTNHHYCPTLRGQVDSEIPKGVNSVLEIVIDGLDADSVGLAMRAGITSACIPGIRKITAGNYGGKLGKFHFHLHEIMNRSDAL